MEQEDITQYLIAQSEPAEGVLKKVVEICEAVDFTGSPKSIFYNGLEGFDKDVQLEFEITPTDALNESEKHVHSNFTFLEWHNDELLRELADLLEENFEETQARVDSVSLLTGDHEVLSLESNEIVKSTFSIALYFEESTKKNVADLNLATKKDPDLQAKIKLLEDICKCQFKGFWGGS